jgi:hypothetical protein
VVVEGERPAHSAQVVPQYATKIGAAASALRLCLSVFVCGSLLCASPAGAASQIDGIEHIFGATNVNAVTGHGRLSAGVSADGDLTVLTWPSPSFTDQLAYLSSNHLNARSRPRFGAQEGAGLFLGLVVERTDSSVPRSPDPSPNEDWGSRYRSFGVERIDSPNGREVTWLRNRDEWRSEQTYGPGDGANVWTTHTSERLGLEVTVVDAVRPDASAAQLLVRSVSVRRNAGSPVGAAWLLAYANLSPVPPNSRVPELPVVDWLFDGSNDFAALWDASAGAIVHFHPGDQLVYDDLLDFVTPPAVAYGAIGDQLIAGTPEEDDLRLLASGLDDVYAAGAYLALTTIPAPDQHQIGYDATPLCASRDEIADNILALPEVFPGSELPIDAALIDLLRCRGGPSIPEREGWTHAALDAFEDAVDGELSGSSIAAGEVNETLRTPLRFEAGEARAAVVLAAAPTAGEAREALASIESAEAAVQEAEDALSSWLATVRLPAGGPPEVRAVARRSLINLRVGTDAPSGAIVASISRQPPYGLDWPRDGMFFNTALQVSGQVDVVTRRTALYASWQRARPVAPTIGVDQPPPRDPTTGEMRTYPADAWEMNYYPDGVVGGPLRFEIDNTAFALWTIVSQAGWVADARSYLDERWDTIARAANLLARWRDPETGLQAPASEDDNAAYTQTLHGAVTVFGALSIAARAARLLERRQEAAAWEARACELRAATERLLYDAEARRFVSHPGATFDPAAAPTGQTAWMVWPMQVFPWDDRRVAEQLAADLDLIHPRITLEAPGGSYFMKNTVSLGLARGSDPALGPRIAAQRDLLARAHATPDTHHFGEVMLAVDTTEGRVASQRVANPHLWEGILFYLTAMALEAPDAFDRHDAVLPPSQVPSPGAPCAALTDPTATPSATPSATPTPAPSATAAPVATPTSPFLPPGALEGEGCAVSSRGRPASPWMLLLLAIVRLGRRRGVPPRSARAPAGERSS